MSPKMTDFDLIPSPADDGTLRGSPAGEFFDKLTGAPFVGAPVFMAMEETFAR